MLTLTVTVHLIVSLLLIVLVLIQDSKGGAMGVLSGGGSSSVFGSAGAENFLTKATKWLAIVFATTCISLAYQTSRTESSVLDDYTPAAGAGAVETIDTTKAVDETAPEAAATEEKKDSAAPKSGE